MISVSNWLVLTVIASRCLASTIQITGSISDVDEHLAELGGLLYSDDYTKINLTASEKTKEVIQYFLNHAKEKLGAVGAINPSPNWIGG